MILGGNLLLYEYTARDQRPPDHIQALPHGPVTESIQLVA